MITYDPRTKTIYMSLVDLEHCGFDHVEFESELRMAGLDRNDKNLLWPETLVVNFAGGAVIVDAQPTPAHCHVQAGGSNVQEPLPIAGKA